MIRKLKEESKVLKEEIEKAKKMKKDNPEKDISNGQNELKGFLDTRIFNISDKLRKTDLLL